MKLALFLFLSMSLFAKIPSKHFSDGSAPVQSQKLVDAGFDWSKREFEFRWEQFKKGRIFSQWRMDRPEEEIAAEFDQLNHDRFYTWFERLDEHIAVRQLHPEYMIAEQLILDDHVRCPNCVAFEYNMSCPYYNASNININGLRFLALEGPRSKDESAFFRLLLNDHVTQLIRLTRDYDVAQKKCHPYWLNRVTAISPYIWNLSIPRRDGAAVQIPYFVFEDWVDNEGVDPIELLQFLKIVRQEYNPAIDLMAVHCSAGVGRTGTFIAALSLLHQIDQQLEQGLPSSLIQVSIEETVFKLSLQRFHMVGRKQQYVTLYKLIDLYLKGKG